MGKKTQHESPVIESLNEIKFKGKDGKEYRLGDGLDEDDVFPFKDKYKISYEAIKRIARAAGIWMTGESVVMSHGADPTIAVTVLFSCLTGKGGTCIHDGPTSFSKVGEASHENTRSITGKYKVTTAEKRGFERGVIEHLGFPKIYGESEFDEDESDKQSRITLSMKEQSMIAPLVNQILASRTKKQLKEASASIQEESSNLSGNQLQYLRILYEKQESKLN